jgi:hypothetical protein
MVAPVIDALASERSDVRFGKLNVDENPRTAASFGVQSIPLLVFFRDGREADVSSERFRRGRSRPRSGGFSTHKAWAGDRVAYSPRPAERPRGELDLFTRKVLIVASVMAGCAVLWLARDVLLLVFIAAVLAAGIAPSVRRVRILWRFRFGRKISRGTAVTIVFLPFLAIVLVLGLDRAPLHR